MKKMTTRKILIIAVAFALMTALTLAACSPKPFTPVTDPGTGSVEGNGGIAVKYGEWLYYINGYTSDTNAENTYTDVKDAPRVGSVVRMKLADLEQCFEIQSDKNKTSDDIAQYVREHAETVVPRIYYSGNTTTTQFNGLYIFGDRLYITTPNDELTAGGDTQTSQLVLCSYKLDGSDEQRHFVFEDNTTQLCLLEKSGKVVGTYLTGSKLYSLDVAAGQGKEVTFDGTDKAPTAESAYTSPTWDMAGKCVFFIDKLLNICKLDFGADKYTVVVDNPDVKVEEHEGEEHAHVSSEDRTYTINSVNNGEVYYTVAYSKNPSVSNVKLYWADSAGQDKVAFNSTSQSNLRGYKGGKVLYTDTTTNQDGISFYGVTIITAADGSTQSIALVPAYNKNSITIDRLEGDILYYTANSIKYTLDLSAAEQHNGTPYARNLSSAAGWAAPDFFAHNGTQYIITASSSGGLTVAKFDPANPTKTQNSLSVLLTAAPEEE